MKNEKFNKWELLEEENAEDRSTITQRLKVVNGWLVRFYYVAAFSDTSYAGMTFVPDKYHKWKPVMK